MSRLGVEEDAVADFEHPVELVLPHGCQAGEGAVVADPLDGALDHDVETGAIRVGSGGENAIGVCFDVLRLLLVRAGAEVQLAVQPHRRQRSDVRTTVAPHGRQPEHLRRFQNPDDFGPWHGPGVRLTELLDELRGRLDLSHVSSLVDTGTHILRPPDPMELIGEPRHLRWRRTAITANSKHTSASAEFRKFLSGLDRPPPAVRRVRGSDTVRLWPVGRVCARTCAGCSRSHRTRSWYSPTPIASGMSG